MHHSYGHNHFAIPAPRCADHPFQPNLIQQCPHPDLRDYSAYLGNLGIPPMLSNELGPQTEALDPEVSGGCELKSISNFLIKFASRSQFRQIKYIRA